MEHLPQSLDEAQQIFWALNSQFEVLAAEYEHKIISWAAEADASRVAQPLKDYPFGSLYSASLILVAYLGYVIFGSLWQLGPLRVQLSLYPVRFIYNLTQVVLCSYMCVEAGLIAYRNGYTLTPCIAMNPKQPAVGNLLWLFYVSKILDFLDTVFIISAQKWQQLSFLHVYHHTTIFAFYWLNLRLAYDGDVYLTIVLNGVIHAVMYTYYFVSMHTNEIWWKKYLTIMQMVQFVAMCSQSGYMLYTGCEKFPRRVTALYLAYILSLLVLFLNFYIRSQGRKRTEKSVDKSVDKSVEEKSAKKSKKTN